MNNQVPLKKLKQAYQAWGESRGQNHQAWLDLMDDNVEVHNLDESTPGVTPVKPHATKQDIDAFLSGITDEWDMNSWVPDTFVAEGEKVAVFGRCSWTHKNTGKSVEVSIAHLWRFKNGKAIDFTQIFDSAPVALAAA